MTRFVPLPLLAAAFCALLVVGMSSTAVAEEETLDELVEELREMASDPENIDIEEARDLQRRIDAQRGMPQPRRSVGRNSDRGARFDDRDDGSSRSSAIPPDEIVIDHPVVDEAGVLSQHSVDQLSQKLYDHHEQTGVQMAVLFVETTGSVPISDYSLQVAENWEGGSAKRDDGVLLTFAVDDRANRLELGYGIETLITDRAADRMLEEAAPYLRRQSYIGGAESVVDAVIDRTSHLSPASTIRRPLGQYAQIAFPVLFLWALLHGVLWRRRRGELHEPTGDDYDDLLDGDVDDDSELVTESDSGSDSGFDDLASAYDDSDPLLGSEPKEPMGRSDLLWWAIPVLVIGVAFLQGQGFWSPYLAFWLTIAGLTAITVAHIRPIAIVITAFGLVMPFLFTPFYYDLVPTDGSEIYSFWAFMLRQEGVVTWYFFAFVIFFVFVLPVASGDSQTYGSTGGGSSSSSSFGGGGGFSGGSGGFSGGGGSFGGGGSSGSW